jgi:hypothetical protein
VRGESGRPAYTNTTNVIYFKYAAAKAAVVLVGAYISTFTKIGERDVLSERMPGRFTEEVVNLGSDVRNGGGGKPGLSKAGTSPVRSENLTGDQILDERFRDSNFSGQFFD